MSIFAAFLIAYSNILSTLCLSVISAAYIKHLLFIFFNSFRVSERLSSSMSLMIVMQPSSASLFAIAEPRPLAAPVIIDTLR